MRFRKSKASAIGRLRRVPNKLKNWWPVRTASAKIATMTIQISLSANPLNLTEYRMFS
jgi:hypothetical protein